MRLELRFLERIRRLRFAASEILLHLQLELGVTESKDLLGDVVDHALRVDWTRDPFDVLIVATAMLHRAPLLTKDERIRAHYPDAVW